MTKNPRQPRTPNPLHDRFLALPLAQKAAVLAALLSIPALLILVLASHQGQQQLITHSSELFGESLVKQLSRDASAPLVQNDKLSLQALLNELVASPLIVRSAIYDVENHPIAEAGAPTDGQDFSASITFQDSIAGYAVITVDTAALRQQVSHQSWQLAGLGLLLAALVYMLALYPGRQLSAIINDLCIVATTPLKRRKANTQVAYHGEDELRELSRVLLAGPAEQPAERSVGDFAILCIEITNLPSLQVNLGQQALAQALNALRRQLTTICRLYDGELQASRSYCFSASFSAAEDATGYPFRALCSALIIEQVLNDSELPFHIRQAVVTNDSTLSKLEPVTGRQATLEQGLLMASIVDEGIVLSERVYHHSSIENRIHATALGDGAFLAEQLEDSYQQLLDRQIHTLRSV